LTPHSGCLPTCRDPTRERLKLIARVVNVEEWAKKGPLSSYEHSLLNNYNDKPILTRPQQKFYSGRNYFEMDLDIHSYAWLARKAFSSFIPRLGEVSQSGTNNPVASQVLPVLAP